jgi:hypothetical protein
MAKKPVQVHVQSSDFKALLQSQKDSLASLQSMEAIMKQIRLSEIDNIIHAKSMIEDGERLEVVEKESLKTEKEQLKVSKQMSDSIKKLSDVQKEKDETAEAIATIAKSMKTFKTMSERFDDFIKKSKDVLSPAGLKSSLLKTFNVGGIFNKSIEREKFIKTQRALGSEKTRAELKDDFKGAQQAAKASQKAERDIDDYKKLTGLSEDQMRKFEPGRKLLENRAAATNEYAKFDIRSSQLKNNENVTPTQAHADTGTLEENAIEEQKMIREQSDLLMKIEQNTRGESPDQKAKPKEESGGQGMLSGLLGGGKIGKALEGMKNFGIGLIAIAGALWIASKAFASFAEVEWESVTKGIVALGALVIAAKVLDSMKGSLIKSAGVLGLMALSVWGISKAFGEFAEMDWDTILKGIGAIVALGAVGVVLGKFAGYALAGGAALAALGAGLWVVGKGMQEMGEAFNEFVEGIEKLSNIGFEGLAGVAGGMVLVGGALAAFAAGQIAAGLGTLVSNLLTIGQDSPIEQLEKLGNLGPRLVEAATGIDNIGKAMKAFAGIDKKQMEAINDFPWIRATAFVAAGGAMSANGASVYNQSKANADESAKADGAKGGSTAIVNAPVNNTTRQTQIIKPQIRNQESTQSRYINSRYGII